MSQLEKGREAPSKKGRGRKGGIKGNGAGRKKRKRRKKRSRESKVRKTLEKNKKARHGGGGGLRRNGRKVGDDEGDWMTVNDRGQPHQTHQISPAFSLLGINRLGRGRRRGGEEEDELSRGKRKKREEERELRHKGEEKRKKRKRKMREEDEEKGSRERCKKEARPVTEFDVMEYGKYL
ncbi:hypothetical protein BDDG_05461 [Blastomyces dermatitidis ATCC 18188]|uniref:Uncharacterized protein n=1 Tax=Ajellomyces dermatitidis (strain ATCC 18188 / CBS 674.68) TaxID=653446 RepID=F2TH04_AJEDA|nr:hypothetical protein BDDG_05461 [Blastomyces dermatitidis ATCC 18188]